MILRPTTVNARGNRMDIERKGTIEFGGKIWFIISWDTKNHECEEDLLFYMNDLLEDTVGYTRCDLTLLYSDIDWDTYVAPGNDSPAPEMNFADRENILTHCILIIKQVTDLRDYVLK